MDMRIEAAPMTAQAVLLEVVLRVVLWIIPKVVAFVERIASFSCPDFGSIAANAPNLIFSIGGLAWA